MADQFTAEDLKAILVDRVGMSEADVPDDPGTTFEAAGLDSLAILEIQLEVQQRYGFEIDESEAEQVKTLQDAIDLVNQKLAAA
jgi:acyl carrier protein